MPPEFMKEKREMGGEKEYNSLGHSPKYYNKAIGLWGRTAQNINHTPDRNEIQPSFSLLGFRLVPEKYLQNPTSTDSSLWMTGKVTMGGKQNVFLVKES